VRSTVTSVSNLRASDGRTAQPLARAVLSQRQPVWVPPVRQPLAVEPVGECNTKSRWRSRQRRPRGLVADAAVQQRQGLCEGEQGGLHCAGRGVGAPVAAKAPV
jgi:hypothetical protein